MAGDRHYRERTGDRYASFRPYTGGKMHILDQLFVFYDAQVVGAVGWGNAKLQIPSDILEPIRSLMAACMESDPQKRPDFEEIIVSLRTIRREVQLPTPAVTQVRLPYFPHSVH